MQIKIDSLILQYIGISHKSKKQIIYLMEQ